MQNSEKHSFERICERSASSKIEIKGDNCELTGAVNGKKVLFKSHILGDMIDQSRLARCRFSSDPEKLIRA